MTISGPTQLQNLTQAGPIAVAQKEFGNRSMDPLAIASGLVPMPISILLPPNLTPGVIYLIPNQVVQPLLDLQMNPPVQPPNLSTSSAATLVADSRDEGADSGKEGFQE